MQLQDIWDALSTIPDIIREPAADLTAAVLLLAILTTLLLIAILSAFLFMLRTRPEKRVPIEHASEPASGSTAPDETTDTGGRDRWRRAALTLGALLAVVSVLWVALGISSSDRLFCDSCHTDSPHAGMEASDPHVNTPCVSCHEPGGAVARATVNLPVRVRHVIVGRYAPDSARDYGRPVSSKGCADCHSDEIEGTLVDQARGVSVSHAEPLDAGAECVDCHAPRQGLVTARTVGHDPCLRCHGVGDVPGACSVCHEGDPAYAIRSEGTAGGALARRQVPDPTCGGCHPQTTCDACHGIRMPHSTAFKRYGHARHAASDIWDNGGNGCRLCHYPGHRDCSECHAGQFPSHATTWRVGHQKAPDDRRSCTCHLSRELIEDPTRTFCDICHDPAYQVDR